MARRPESIQGVIDSHDRFVDSVVEDLLKRVSESVTKATARTVAEVQRDILQTGGEMRAAAVNLQYLRGLDRVFLRNLKAAGYDRAIASFTRTFPRHFVFFGRTFRAINRQLKNPLPDPNFGAEQQRFLDSRALSAGKVLQIEASRVAQRAVEQTLVSVGALPIEQLVARLAEEFGKLPAHVSSLAATAASTHYRVLNDQAYRAVEQETGPLRYRYYGPRDKLNRRFCRMVLENNIPRTRRQINRLDNSPQGNRKGGLKPVFTAAGGFNCRHVWLPANPS